MRSIRIRAAVMAALPFLIAGCFFNLSEKKDFKSWYYGDPGLAGALGEENCDRYADHIQGQRHPYYLHFRTPEILLQPQGGAQYPERTTSESRLGARNDTAPSCEKVAKGWETFRFDTVDAGLVDAIIPYRKSSAVNDHEMGFGREGLAYTKGVVYNTGLTAVMKAPVYIVHDILKTLYIPVAGTYYLFKADAPPETSAEIIQVRGEPLPEDVPQAAADSADRSTSDDQSEETPAAVPPADPAPGPAVDASAEAETETVAAPPRPVAGEDPPLTVARTETGDEVSDMPGADGGTPPVTADRAAAAEEAFSPDSVSGDDIATQAPVDADADAADNETAATDGAGLPAAAAAATGHAGKPPTGADAAEGEIAPTDRLSEKPESAVSDTDENGRQGQAAETPSAAESMPAPAPPAEELAGTPVTPAPEEGEATDARAHTVPIPADEAPETMVPVDGAADDAETVSMPETEAPDTDAAGREVDGAAWSTDVETEPAPPTVAEPESDTATAASTTAVRETGDESETASMTPAEPVWPEADQPPPALDDDASVSPLRPEAEVADATAAAGPGEGPVSVAPPSSQEAGDMAAAAAVEAPAVELEDSEPEVSMDQAMTADTETGRETEADPGADAAVAQGTLATGRQTDGVGEEDRVGAAAASLGALARGGTGPVTSPDRPEDAPTPPPAETPGGGIVEEDLLADAPSGDGPLAAREATGTPDHPQDTTPADPDDPPPTIASVTPDQEAVSPEMPATLGPIDKVRLLKRSLHKKAAFIGFFSRAVNVDEMTKAYLQELVWPVFKDECQKNLMLVRRGDTDYPVALDALLRDQFGHLNSFELITVARYNGLNAIIAGTIIDIRVSKELGGMLWYKTPEGRLRLTILAEVFDAETGTKLFDHTYIREEEVEELEPGADEKLRTEDLPILDAALKSVAAQMGDQICDALEDQPWRAFVSGIDGNRITLSSGQNAGLKPGNILGVYNSQIIDGLNNQQFFLTGEKVGRIQIINVSANQSEALLIEGQGLRDYSVAIPE